MEVILMRHTRPEGTSGRCYGHAEVPLADTFPQEALALCSELPEGLQAVYSSPSGRCMQLARYLQQRCCPSAPLHTDERLRELHFGAWEGRLWSELPEEEVRDWSAAYVHTPPQGGESLQQLYQRVAAFMEQLSVQPLERIALVGHAGSLRCIWAYVLGIPLPQLMKLQLPFGQRYKLTLSPDPDFRQIQFL